MSEEKHTLYDLCLRTRLDERFVIQCVEYGVVHVAGNDSVEWRFTTTALLRLQKAWRLHRDLDVNVDNLALVLDLLEERDQLLGALDDLRARLGHWEPR